MNPQETTPPEPEVQQERRSGLDRVRTLLAQAENLRRRNPDGAVALAREALDLVGADGDAARRAEILCVLSDCHTAGAQVEDGEDAAREALLLAEDASGRAAALACLGACSYLSGEYTTSRVHYEEALDLLRQEGLRNTTTSKALNGLGAALHRQARSSEALEAFSRALALAEELDDRPLTARIRANIANTHFTLGDAPSALESYLPVAALQRELGDRLGLASTLHNIASILLELEATEEALEYLEESQRLATELGSRHLELLVLLCLARVHLNREDPDSAHAPVRRAIELARMHGSHQAEARGLHLLAQIHRTRGEHEEALERYWEAGAIADRLGWALGQVARHLGCARVHLGLGDPGKAIAELAPLCEAGHPDVEPRFRRELHGLLAQAHEEVGNYQEAIHHLREAREAEQQERGAGLRARLDHVRATQDLALARLGVESVRRQGQARLQSILENTPNVALQGYDAEGKICLWNPAAMAIFGWTEEEALGRSAEELFVPSDEEGWFAGVLATVRSTGTASQPQERRFRRRDGSEGTVFTTVFPIVEEGGGRVVVRMDVDVTQQKVLEEQVRHSQKMEAIGRLAAGVAHDFNNMLTVMLGYSESLSLTLGPHHPGQKSAEMIRRAAERAATLTNQLLAISRRQATSPVQLDLNGTITNLESMFRPLVGEGIRLQMELDPVAGQILADPSQIEQVLLNLIVNARDAMPFGGILTISTGETVIADPGSAPGFDVAPGPYTYISIRDTGCGMDEDTMDQIFEPFFTTKESGKGTGLGLSTVYGIVRQAGGFLTVESQPEVGSDFRVHLPRAQHAPEPPPEPESGRREVKGTETILMVEDDPPVRQFAAELLEEAGYKVLTAGSGEEAIALVQQSEEQIHLLLADVVLAGESGPGLAEWLQMIIPDLRILYMSGYSAETIRQRGGHRIEHQLLQKPFGPGALLAAVRQTLALG